jgi:hypothetical protein
MTDVTNSTDERAFSSVGNSRDAGKAEGTFPTATSGSPENRPRELGLVGWVSLVPKSALGVKSEFHLEGHYK